MPDPTPGPAPDLYTLIGRLRGWANNNVHAHLTRTATDAANALERSAAEQAAIRTIVAAAGLGDAPTALAGVEALSRALGHQIERGDRLAVELRRVEWRGSYNGRCGYCPVCDGWTSYPDESGHAPDCTLAAALAGEREGGATG